MTVETLTPQAALLRAMASYAGAHDSGLRARNHPADALALCAAAAQIDLDQADLLIQHNLSTLSVALQSVLLEMDVMCSMADRLDAAQCVDAASPAFRKRTLDSRLDAARRTYFEVMEALGIDAEKAETVIIRLHAAHCPARASRPCN